MIGTPTRQEHETIETEETNDPSGVCLRAFSLGFVAGGGILFALTNGGSNPQLGLYLAALALFHTLEYWVTARFNRGNVKTGCKLNPYGS